MKITEVRLGKISVPLRTPFKTALRTVGSVEDVIVEIHTDDGRTGYGEAPPTGAITGVYENGCKLFRKRMECAIMVAIARALGDNT